MDLLDDAICLFKCFFHCIALDKDVSVICIQNEFTFFRTVHYVIYINEKEERAKYGALWYAEHDWKIIRLLGKKLSILGSISKIAAEEIVRNSSNTEVRKFYKKFFVRDSIKGLTQIDEYTNNMLFVR